MCGKTLSSTSYVELYINIGSPTHAHAQLVVVVVLAAFLSMSVTV